MLAYQRYRGGFWVLVYPIIRWFYWRWFWGQEAEKIRREGGGQDQPLWGTERAVLVEQLCEFLPCETVLEVGCGYAQNAHILAPLFPEVKFLGIDPSEERIRGASELLGEAKLGNVSLSVGGVEDLSSFADGSFEVVMTSACLLYISPMRIEAAVTELLRVSSKALVILEPQTDEISEEAIYGQFFAPGENDVSGHYVRNYKQLVMAISKKGEAQKLVVSLHPVRSPLWQTESWQDNGCVTSIIKR